MGVAIKGHKKDPCADGNVLYILAVSVSISWLCSIVLQDGTAEEIG